MDSNYTLALETQPVAADMNAIVGGLLSYNQSHTGEAAPHYVVLTVRDEEKKLVGGLVGAIYLGWLQISALWLQEELRGRGFGKRLLEEAEQEALRRGCHKVCLETLGFQALPFYEKHGYVRYAELPDFGGHVKYSLKKSLHAAPPTDLGS